MHATRHPSPDLLCLCAKPTRLYCGCAEAGKCPIFLGTKTLTQVAAYRNALANSVTHYGATGCRQRCYRPACTIQGIPWRITWSAESAGSATELCICFSCIAWFASLLVGGGQLVRVPQTPASSGFLARRPAQTSTVHGFPGKACPLQTQSKLNGLTTLRVRQICTNTQDRS